MPLTSNAALSSLQKTFATALFNPDAESALYSLIIDSSLPKGERLEVYRNNVLQSLTEVLEDVYPVVKRLVSPQFFRYAASEFIKRYLPTTGCLHEYGEEFAQFLSSFPPTTELLYLPEIAALEWACHRAYYVADKPLLTASDIEKNISKETAFVFHPSVSFFESLYPLDKIWSAHENSGYIDLNSGKTQGIVVRQEYTIHVHWMEYDLYEFLYSLYKGSSLAEIANLKSHVSISEGIVWGVEKGLFIQKR